MWAGGVGGGAEGGLSAPFPPPDQVVSGMQQAPGCAGGGGVVPQECAEACRRVVQYHNEAQSPLHRMNCVTMQL